MVCDLPQPPPEDVIPVTLRVSGDGLWVDTNDPELLISSIVLVVEGVRDPTIGFKISNALSDTDSLTYIMAVDTQGQWVESGRKWVHWEADQVPIFHKWPNTLAWVLIGRDPSDPKTWIRCLDWNVEIMNEPDSLEATR